MSETEPQYKLPEVYPNMFNGTLLSDEELDQIMEKPNQGVYLLRPRTGKGWFQTAMARSHAVLFMRASDADIVAVGFGEHAASVLHNQAKLGFFVKVR